MTTFHPMFTQHVLIPTAFIAYILILIGDEIILFVVLLVIIVVISII